MSSFSKLAFVSVILVAISTARAQRVDENALVAATDAFGTSVGLQTIGLYSPTNARGFNPTQAGNIRIEGLFFDQQTSLFNGALFSGSEMRIGIAAQSYLFPSPTGIADFSLRMPGEHDSLSLVTTHGPFDESTIELDGQYSLVEGTLNVGVSALDFQNFDYQAAQRSRESAYSAVLRYQPSEHFEIVPFYGYIGGGEHRELPFVFADGVHPAPKFEGLLLPAQDWTSWGWRQTTAGVISKGRISSNWSLAAGTFLSAEEDPQVFNDLLIGPSWMRAADHVMDVVPPSSSHSYSGELRLTYLSIQGDHEHRLEFTARARQVERHFGGDSVTDFGSVALDRDIQTREPTLAFSMPSRDDTHQTGGGISYVEHWQNVGALSLGLLKTTYARTISSVTGSSAPQRTDPVLPNLSVTIQAHPGVTLYSSYVRGLEDSVIAPPTALNRGEPPPATASRQVDGGVHWVVGNQWDFLLGGFDVHKPFFNIDANNIYRQIGRITNQGIEVSATLMPVSGVKIVAGFVRNDPKVDLDAIPAGIHRTPIGPVPSTINLNGDFAPAEWRGWGASVQWTRLSSRVETDDDLHSLPPLSTLNLGLRLARKCLSHPCSVRLDIANLTDASGLTVSSQYLFLPQLRRNFMFTAAVDI